MKTFPMLYRAHDDVDGQPVLRTDDGAGRLILNVTLSGYVVGAEPSPTEWAEYVEHACNNHERLVDALNDLETSAFSPDRSGLREAGIKARAILREINQ